MKKKEEEKEKIKNKKEKEVRDSYKRFGLQRSWGMC